MKFLVLAKPNTRAPAMENPLATYQAAKEYLDAKLADGTFDCVYQFADGRRGIGIANADSHEELWEKLTAYPLYPFQDYKVQALVDLDYVFDKSFERIKKMMGE